MLSDGYANTLSREGPDDDSAVMEGVGHSQRVGSGGKPHEVSLGLGDAPSLVPQACRERIAALLDDADDWQDLDREVGEAALRAVDAVYLPVTGRDAPRYADDALRSLDAIGRAPRPLGNTEWEGLQASKARASRLGAVFTQDFFVSPGAADAFGRRYRELSGIGQDRLALIGYDITRLVLREAEADEVELADALRAAPTFDGLGHRFQFGGGQVNEALYILGFRDGQAVLLE